eukprot:2131296-Prymnesium_polylepis.1
MQVVRELAAVAKLARTAVERRHAELDSLIGPIRLALLVHPALLLARGLRVRVVRGSLARGLGRGGIRRAGGHRLAGRWRHAGRRGLLHGHEKLGLDRGHARARLVCRHPRGRPRKVAEGRTTVTHTASSLPDGRCCRQRRYRATTRAP